MVPTFYGVVLIWKGKPKRSEKTWGRRLKPHIRPLGSLIPMKTDVTRDNRSIGIDQSERHVDLSHAAGRRVRIRELIQLHESVTVGEIIQEMNRSVETNRSEIIETISELNRAGYVMILDGDSMGNREVRLV